MDDFWTRVVDNMTARLTGPMQLRLLLQPLMAAIFAIRSGLADAGAGKPPYFWALFSDPAHRAEMVKDGWKSVGKVFVLALILDVIYQIVATRYVYRWRGDRYRPHACDRTVPDPARPRDSTRRKKG